MADGQQATTTNAVAYAPSDKSQTDVAKILPHNNNLTNGAGTSIERDIMQTVSKIPSNELEQEIMLYPTPIAKLIDSYSKLPGIRMKTATRLTLNTIDISADDVNEFAKNLLSAKRELTLFDLWTFDRRRSWFYLYGSDSSPDKNFSS